MKAIIFGAPGAGKGTYSTRMQNQLGVDVIAMGDIFRESVKQNTELGKKVKSYVEKGALVPDEVVLEVLKDRLKKVPKGKGFLLDGFPRTIAQAESLQSIAKIDVILMLDVPDQIIIERLTSRRLCKSCGAVYNIRFLKPKVEGKCDKCGGELYQRSDDNEAVIRNRLQVYKTQTEPLVEYYRKKNTPFIVNVTKSVDQPPEPMVEHMMAELKKMGLA
ncbi:MAG: adenylate kinase [Candidatus Bathyarchaeota archaeon]|nr:adenylate kinase [Candidatus Bathyarchaeota archaeon]MDD4325543.1 adenylate kinase [Candidatus Bathyarchaeota archaeon]MDI9578297.1 adenylate kinase [Thermoproteota archaeon]MDT8781292.1 adenylate kinase [Candidatus Bathyarchaeota archaeon]NLD65739.1 adenylate kinase [Thermoproteota archaeon]